MNIQVHTTYPSSVEAPGEIKPVADGSLDSVQRLHFTSSLHAQCVAAQTAEVKRSSTKTAHVPQQSGACWRVPAPPWQTRQWIYIPLSFSHLSTVFLQPVVSVIDNGSFTSVLLILELCLLWEPASDSSTSCSAPIRWRLKQYASLICVFSFTRAPIIIFIIN